MNAVSLHPYQKRSAAGVGEDKMVGERDEGIVGHDAWRVGLNWNLKGDRDRT